MNTKAVAALGSFALIFSAAPFARSAQEQHVNEERDRTAQRERTPQAQTQAQRQIMVRGRTTQTPAQRQAMEHRSATATLEGHKANTLTESQLTSDQLTSASATNARQNRIASVENLVIDRDGYVVAGLVSVGGLMGAGASTKLLSWDDVLIMRTDAGEVDLRVSMTEDQLKNLPDSDSDWDALSNR